MFAWALFFKENARSGNAQLAFDPRVVANSKVSNTSGDVRTIKQNFHGVLSTEVPKNDIDIEATSSQRQSEIAAAMGYGNFDKVVELIHKGNFVYLCQRNNFQFTRDHFVEVEDRFVDDSFEPVVILKHVEGISSEETSNNVEIELLKLFEAPLFRDLMEHISEQHDLDESCLEYHVTADETGEPMDAICVSLQLLRYLGLFTRDVSEDKKSIVEDVNKTKVVMGIFRYFTETDSVGSDDQMIFRLKFDRT